MNTPSMQALLDELKSREQGLRTKIEEMKRPLMQAEEDLRCIQGTIAFYERTMPSGAPRPAGFTATITGIPDLRGMTQKRAVIAIAKANGGIIRARDAKKLLISQSVMRETKNSTRMVHNAIIGTDRFERIAPGEYRLKIPTPPSTTPAGSPAAALFPPKGVQ